jgi:hypothetical protein
MRTGPPCKRRSQAGEQKEESENETQNKKYKYEIKHSSIIGDVIFFLIGVVKIKYGTIVKLTRPICINLC